MKIIDYLYVSFLFNSDGQKQNSASLFKKIALTNLLFLKLYTENNMQVTFCLRLFCVQAKSTLYSMLNFLEKSKSLS